jgi:Raf kinase inhibitor-like YbhB/YbcL family protein
VLKNFPRALGRALKTWRAGENRLAFRANELYATSRINIESAAFADGQLLPRKYTADGEGLSPPLRWTGAPAQARCVAMIVEDADAPTLWPLVHSIVPSLPVQGELEEGELSNHVQTGRNSYLRHGYLPPDPPPGHGVHRYAFQVFAFKEAPVDPTKMSRRTLIAWMKDKVLAKGCLIGTYERP